MAKDILIQVSGIGFIMCFVNIDRDEAIRRFKKHEGLPEDSLRYSVTELEFDEAFIINYIMNGQYVYPRFRPLRKSEKCRNDEAPFEV